MATQGAIEEAEIRLRIDRMVQAIRAADLEGVKAIYAPDIVSFDVVPKAGEGARSRALISAVGRR